MDVLVVALAGALIGGFSAKRRGGNRLDIAQYAVVFAIIFAVAGMVLSVLLTRLIAG